MSVYSRVQAILINRVGDIFLFLGLVSGYVVICLIGALTKSSLWVFRVWLGNAIEGPTPVSSMLHSSTIVVARVYLLSVLESRVVEFFYIFIGFSVLIRVAG